MFWSVYISHQSEVLLQYARLFFLRCVKRFWNVWNFSHVVLWHAILTRYTWCMLIWSYSKPVEWFLNNYVVIFMADGFSTLKSCWITNTVTSIYLVYVFNAINIITNCKDALMRRVKNASQQLRSPSRFLLFSRNEQNGCKFSFAI